MTPEKVKRREVTLLISLRVDYRMERKELEGTKELVGKYDFGFTFEAAQACVIAGCLSEEEIQGLKEMFKSMDSDNSGSITLEELKHGLAKQGTKLTEYEVKQLMEAADADGNGTIDYEEFITSTMHMNRMDREEHLYTAFQYFDKDNSGYITRDELEQALKEKGMFDEKEIKD
ncbi:calcium-dependent protein kinase 2-like isoform X1 [Canna indica]|uniref:Calcium-dependent protein kinase 2-like isoform X1 n=1 Tax=Canna indica TaxID=4628 RepID=A0AAQ3Q772_9LILI|nr:calcium-dependent protein kinase 2-like isoform X1 [Canna indica]